MSIVNNPFIKMHLRGQELYILNFQVMVKQNDHSLISV